MLGSGNSTFVVQVLGLTLGAFRAVRGLEVEVDVLEYHEGGVNDLVHRLPGAVRYPNVVLSGGLTSQGIETWFSKTQLGAERHAMTLTLMSRSGERQRSWSFADAFPIRWSGPVFDSNQTSIVGEELEVAHAGLTADP